MDTEPTDIPAAPSLIEQIAENDDEWVHRLRKMVAAGALLSGVTMRDYQTDAVDRILQALQAGHRRVLLLAPTGSGKTIMFSALAAAFHADEMKVLVVAHRKELIAQAVEKLHASGIPDVGVRRGKRHSHDGGSIVQVASIQSLKPGLIDADLVIVDEAHHCPAETYQRLLEMFPSAVHVGPTATPWWGGNKGLGAYFQAIVTAETVRGLTEAGYLARVRMFTHPHTFRELDLRGLKSKGGDYATSSLAERVDRPALLGDIVAHWQSHAGGARTLCFAASVEHSQHIAAKFRAAGVKAEHVDGGMPEKKRDAILARLRAGDTRVVCNFNVLTEGFDAPEVGCVVFARPTRRPGVYMQAIGRGLRIAEGKTSVVVLDHAGSCLMHGLPDADRDVSLDGADPTGEKAGRLPVRWCPECGLMVHIAVRECPECSETLGRDRTFPTEEPTGVLVEVATNACGPLTLTYNGKTMTVPAWAKEIGISPLTIYGRLDSGWPIEDILSLPQPRVAKAIEVEGKRVRMTDVARALRVPIESLLELVNAHNPDSEEGSKPRMPRSRLPELWRASTEEKRAIRARLAAQACATAQPVDGASSEGVPESPV